MLDLNFIREHTDEVKEALAKLHAVAPIDEILKLDEERRTLLAESETLRARRNAVSKEMGALQRQIQQTQGKDQEKLRERFAETREEMRQVGERIKAIEEQMVQVETLLKKALLEVPNMPHESVPVGADESDNLIVRTEGEPRQFDFEPLPHWELGPMLGLIDFERGVKISGTRFYVLTGLGARLQRALTAWMLDLHVMEHGYTEVYLPFMVKQDCMWGAGQFPKFRENVYYDTEDDLYLVPTAEVPITNLHRDEILEPGTLPLRYVACTPCFRREKMSAGRDTRGIKRVHQFDKVEMYKFVEPHTSYDELEAMVRDAEDICRGLGIPHRIVQMCTGDLGFQAAKKYDVEMWAPGCGEWLEVSSLSNCEEFQARRANIRYRPAKGEKPRFVHTLNGSGLALPRVMIAIMENYQQADGSIAVPEVLIPYMGGIREIKV
ncbi:MAG: serine--tRNA ligase [Anaerolineae bacterium]|jgi:seryl-tRNA synthetase|nr:serine--tRNA ligase [Anaerolineae bacterium]MDH7474980.1 serine--tRNA ligase [Anaerolineae bacterium]